METTNSGITLALMGALLVVMAYVVLALHRRLKVIEGDEEEESLAPAVQYVETMGMGGRIVLFADDDINEKLEVLRGLRLEAWRLAIDSEIADHYRNLETPAEERKS
jgi:hypothetical protein